MHFRNYSDRLHLFGRYNFAEIQTGEQELKALCDGLGAAS
jgi:hypothetical protein